MAMKKKFLGLALATMVAMPATGVYAAGNTGNTQTITGKDTSTLNHTIPVTGSVTKSDGTAAAGQITVELPTAMAFAVNENGDFSGATYGVSNQSGCGIDIFVSQFEATKSGITLKKEEELTSENRGSFDRSNVSLVLKGLDNNGRQTKVDLAKIADGTTTSETDKKVLNIGSGAQKSIALTGTAGTADAEDGVDKTGATGEFNLVFSIKKDNN